MNVETEICGLKLRNPTMLAAGILGMTASSLNRIYDHGAGAVVTKSFTKNPKKGYKNPVIVEVDCGILNAIGLSNPGVKIFKEELKKVKKEIPIIASIAGSSPKEFAEVSKEVSDLVDMIEINVSCPHAGEGYGSFIGQDPKVTYEVVKAVKKAVNLPVSVKLTANVADIVEIAINAKKGGCDALTLINSVGPGMKIDIKTAKPVLSNRFGGLSGPAIKPIAIRCVYEIYENMDMPIIGVGGITTYKDVIEFLYAGARAVQIGTGILYKGVNIFQDIVYGLKKFMKENNFKSVDEMVGLAHR